MRKRVLANGGGALALVVLALLACKQPKEEPKEQEVAPVAEVVPPRPPAATTVAPVPVPPAAAVGTSAGAVSVGVHVAAPWSRAGSYYPGTITEVYGKLGRVKFEDGDAGWARVDRMRPKGTPGADPTGETCAFAVGAKVRAPWSAQKAMYSGKVSEVYGRLARVDFLDGDQGWAECKEMQVRE